MAKVKIRTPIGGEWHMVDARDIAEFQVRTYGSPCRIYWDGDEISAWSFDELVGKIETLIIENEKQKVSK